MIAKDEAGGEAIKLTDFGLAKLLQPDEEITQGSNLTEMGEACGTPFYMSPEQIIGQPLNPTSDIYSLGVILHQMLTAKMPIEGNSVRQVLALKINRDLAPPSAKFPFLPSTLDPVLQKVLARDPGKRYQTAGEFLQAYELAVSEITTEFSETTEPSIDRELLADVRSTLAQSPAARSYSESGPTGPLKAPVASYFESAPTGPLVAPPTSPSMPVASAPKLDASSPKQDPLPVAGSQTKLLLIIIGLLALIVIVLGILLFSQR
jgi:serine/threonine-protein kinase